MYKDKIEEKLLAAIIDLGFLKPHDTFLYIPENSSLGDYSSNVALQLSKQKHKNDYQTPIEIANVILEKLGHPQYLEQISVAGPGFINFYLKDQALAQILDDSEQAIPFRKKIATGTRVSQSNDAPKTQHNKQDDGSTKRYLVEYGQLNTHKAFHIGHFRNISIGESISRLLEYQGHQVFRVTYGGDIGPHVAKAIWGILKLKEQYEEVKSKPLRDKAEFLGKAYALGSQFYQLKQKTSDVNPRMNALNNTALAVKLRRNHGGEPVELHQEEPKAKEEIDQINTKLYTKDTEVVPLWEETKLWSIGYFETIYLRLGTEFDAQIWESEVEEKGTQIVKSYIDKVFIKDQGAIIFPGEKYGLHNRVFITSKGYPTYEAKELGLTLREQELFPYDISLHIVASEQSGFFKVVIKALEMIQSIQPDTKRHVSYGMVNLSSGKMSSRKGQVITAEDLIEEVQKAIKASFKESKYPLETLEKIAVAAIKFFYLKYAFTSDIAFDIQKSVSLQGDSGPYVLYVFARINSLLNRAIHQTVSVDSTNEADKKSDSTKKPQIAQSFDSTQDKSGLEPQERELLRKLEYFETITASAANNLQPNQLTAYLLELSKAFNSFYESCPIIGSDKQESRLKLIKKTAEVIKLGLYLLGIETVERM